MARQFQASEVLSECLQPPPPPPPTSPHLRPQHSREATGCCWTPFSTRQAQHFYHDFSCSQLSREEHYLFLFSDCLRGRPAASRQ